MAPRSIWNGTIVFGLVTVPVKVYSATESKSIHFHQVHLADGARIEHRKVCPKDDKEVPNDEIVKGYELSNGSFVELAKEEIAAAAGERSKLIDVEHFVDGRGDRSRLLRQDLLPRRRGRRRGRLPPAAQGARDQRQGGDRALDVPRPRAARRRPPAGKILSLQVMNFHDEVVQVDDLDLPSPQRNPSDREIEMAGKLVKSLAAKFEPEHYEDTYREAVLAVIKRKAKGEEIVAEPEETKQQDADDLMAALEASL